MQKYCDCTPPSPKLNSCATGDGTPDTELSRFRSVECTLADSISRSTLDFIHCLLTERQLRIKQSLLRTDWAHQWCKATGLWKESRQEVEKYFSSLATPATQTGPIIFDTHSLRTLWKWKTCCLFMILSRKGCELWSGDDWETPWLQPLLRL